MDLILNINSIIIKKKKNENDGNKIYEEKKIKSNETANLLLLKGNKHMKKMIQIKFEESEYFSSPFDLEEMGDIDVKIPINEDLRKKLEKQNKKINKKIKEWEKNEKLKMENKEKKNEDIGPKDGSENNDDEDDFEEDEINTSSKKNNINNENNKINAKKKNKKESEKNKEELTPEEVKKKKEEEK